MQRYFNNSFQQQKSLESMIEEDGTEVDEEEYFQTIKDNTMLMLLFKDDIWTPYGQRAS